MNLLHVLTAFFFDRVILRHPVAVLVCLSLTAGFLGYHIRNFGLDASAETLVLENDADLRYLRQINARYQQNDFLALAYTAKDDLFSEPSLHQLRQLRDELAAMPNVCSVVTILDVPLLQSPPLSLSDLTRPLPTLSQPDVNRDLAKKEFLESPLYSNLLLSADTRTTAILIYFADDTLYNELLQKRNHLREKESLGTLTPQERIDLDQVLKDFRRCRDQARMVRHQDIRTIRAIMDKYRGNADLFLGGVSMIADDMITYVRNDLKIFGTGVTLCLMMMLGVIFRSLRWVWLPMLCCVVSVLCMMGLLGLFGWEVTVVSSNFVSLQLIITLSGAIHLGGYYRELLNRNPDRPNHQLILDTVCHKIKPSVYCMLTTIAGFASLLLADILPVSTFGWMMIAGLVVSLIITFVLFPAVLILLPKEAPQKSKGRRFALTPILAQWTPARGGLILCLCGAIMNLSSAGISKLTVENCFIDYFKESTEIYQGMKLIDQRLGGTTPLDVIVDFAKPQASPAAATPAAADTDDIFDAFDELDQAQSQDKYWFTAEKMDRINAVHHYLETLPETGKVLSLANLMAIASGLKGGPLDSLDLSLLYSETPNQFKTLLIAPYVSVDQNEARFQIRIKDSQKGLRRNELLKKIRAELPAAAGLEPSQIHLTGMFVLYNNMLQSLFGSQILTLGLTALLLTGMFLVLFRSVKIALIAISVNLLPIGAVLGIMGWLHIPLDMMTITIAAISLGIAVDDTIHYIHRFKREFQDDPRYVPVMHRCHSSIGHAMYYTSITVIIGFSILSLSNFIPTVYFGLLTVMAMIIALLAALTLLPELLILVKPFGKEIPNPTKPSGE
jgi:predicted RND superfamily exporter protein